MKLYVCKRKECGRLRRVKVTVYTRRSQVPHRQGQKWDENEKDMYGPPEVNTSKRLGSAGHCALPVYIMGKTLVAWWEPVAEEAICKKGEEETVWTLQQWYIGLWSQHWSDSLRGGSLKSVKFPVAKGPVSLTLTLCHAKRCFTRPGRSGLWALIMLKPLNVRVWGSAPH